MKKIFLVLLMFLFNSFMVLNIFANEFDEYSDPMDIKSENSINPSKDSEVVGYYSIMGECISHNHELVEDMRLPIKEIKESQTDGDKFHLYCWTDPETQKKYVYFRTYDIALMERHPERGIKLKNKKLLFDESVGIVTITGWDNRDSILYSTPHFCQVTCKTCGIYKKPILWLPKDYMLVEEAEEPIQKSATMIIPVNNGSNIVAGTIFEYPLETEKVDHSSEITISDDIQTRLIPVEEKVKTGEVDKPVKH